jgi:hypothetical protein
MPVPKPPASEPTATEATEPAVVEEPVETQTPEVKSEDLPQPEDEHHHHFPGLHHGHHGHHEDGQEHVDTKPIPWWAFWRRPKAQKKVDPTDITPGDEKSDSATDDADTATDEADTFVRTHCDFLH